MSGVPGLGQQLAGLSLQPQEVQQPTSLPLNQVLHSNGHLLHWNWNLPFLTHFEGAEIAKILQKSVKIESRFPEVPWHMELSTLDILNSVVQSVPQSVGWDLQLIGGAVPALLRQYFNRLLGMNNLSNFSKALQEGITARGEPKDVDFRLFLNAPKGAKVNLLNFSQNLINIMANSIPDKVVESANVLALLKEKFPKVQFTPENKEEYRKQIAINTGFQKIKRTISKDVSYYTMTPNVAKGVIGPEIIVALSMPKVTLFEHDDICLDITKFLAPHADFSIYPLSCHAHPLQVAMDFVTKTTVRSSSKDRTLSAWSRTLLNMLKGFRHRDGIFTVDGVSDEEVGKELGRCFRYHLDPKEDVKAKLILLALIASEGRDLLPTYLKEVENIVCEEGSSFSRAVLTTKATPRAILAALPLFGYDVPSPPPCEEITEEVLPLFYSSDHVERTALASGLVHENSPMLQELGIHFGKDPSLARIAMILPDLIPHIQGERQGRMQGFLQLHGVTVDFEEVVNDPNKWIRAFAKSTTREFVDKAVVLLLQLPQKEALSHLPHFANNIPES